MMITDGSLHKLTELITDAPRPVTLELPVPGKESKESPPSKDKKAPEKPESKKQEKAPKPGKKTKGLLLIIANIFKLIIIITTNPVSFGSLFNLS